MFPKFKSSVSALMSFVIGATPAIAGPFEYKKTVPQLVVSAASTPPPVVQPPAAAQLSLSAPSLDFSGKVVGLSSRKSVVVTNTSAQSVTWSGAPRITGAASFTVASSSCAGTLAAGTSCTLEVQFAPTQVAPVSAQLSLTTGSASAQVALTGDGSGASPLDISGPSSDLVVRQGETASGTVTLANNTDTALVLGSIGLTGTSASRFSVGGSNCNGKTLQPGTLCTITVTLSGGTSMPATAGSVSAALSVPVSGATQSYALSGSIVERAYALLSGGSQSLPSLSTRELCYNRHFSVYGGAQSQYTCAAGGGVVYADSIVSCTTCLVYLDGATLSTRTLAFGSMTVGVSKTMQVLLENETAEPISFNTPALSLTAGLAGNVSVSTSCATVAPGDSCLLQVDIAPSAASTYSGVISLATNAGGSPHRVSFTGTASYLSSNVGAFTVPSVSYGAAAFNLTAPSSDSPGAWSFSSSNTAVATISGATVTVVGGGSTTITATQAASGSYGPSTKTATLTVSALDATVGVWPDLDKTVGDTFTLTAPTSNSNGAWTYSSSDSTAATVSGSGVTAKKAGTYTLTATQAATANYKSSSRTATLVIAKATPVVGTWSALTASTTSAPFALTFPSSNSSGAWSATSSNPAVATVSGSTITVVGAGTTTITGTQAATVDYLAATASTTLTVSATYASSCQSYLQANPGAVSGWYTLDVDGAGAAAPQSYYCDMTSDGGGWTRIVRQTEAAPVTNWNGGINGSSYALSTLNIPSHTQVGFGKDDTATFVDYVNWTYQTGNIAASLVLSPKSGLQYYVHRNAAQFYSYHDPRSQLYSQTGDVNGTWANTLALTRNSGATGSGSVGWAFTPANETALRRGFRMQSSLLWTTSEAYAWTVWVR